MAPQQMIRPPKRPRDLSEWRTILTMTVSGSTIAKASHNARRKLIEAGENQTVKIAESEPLRRFSSQHIELVAQRQDLRLERNP